MTDYGACKRELLAAAQWLCDNGYFGTKLGSGGNVSLMVRPANLIAITPSRKAYCTMRASDICIVDSRLNRIDGRLPASMEAPMHAGVYASRPDVNAVVHTHQVYASVLALINQPIPALFDEITADIGTEVAVIPYALSGTAALVDNVVARIENGCHCYLIQNHGALCLGTDLTEAMHRAELLEKAAQAYVYALCSGRNISRLPDEAVGQLLAMRTSSPAPSKK